MLATRSPNTLHRRTAFTLIEVLMVVVIIGILAAFIVPAVGGALKRARVTSVRVEISQFETAIGKFRSVYNMDPPSNITLYETSAGWTGDPNSSALIRQLWPQFAFGVPHDINGDGDMTDTISLSQGECLVFFLGGMNGNTVPGTPTADNNIPGHIGACTGFSKNPADPFARGGNREAPFFEFLPARFTDLPELPAFPTGDGFPEYRDPLPSQTMPYIYYSSYDGTGYATAEFGLGALVQPYRTGAAATAPVWKPNSYQIISPGYDRNYGYGGGYVASGTDRLPLPTPAPAPIPAQRAFEVDNITNFSDGELQP